MKSMYAYLRRLIFVGVLPLLAVAVYLGIDDLRQLKALEDREAINRVEDIGRAIDQTLTGHLGGLSMLADSPAINEAGFRDEALRFARSFGGHVILADTQSRMLINTRVAPEKVLPALPVPQGRAAVPEVLRTGKPAVGDMFTGPLAHEALVVLAVPVLREGRVTHVLLNTIEVRTLQRYLDATPLPAGWTATLADSTGAMMARSPIASAGGEAGHPRTYRSPITPWTLTLTAPTGWQSPKLRSTMHTLALAILGATLASLLGAAIAARRLSAAVATLASPSGTMSASGSAIFEIEAARHVIDESEARLAAALTAAQASERRYRELFESNPHSMWVYDLRTLAFLAVNDAAVAHYGYSHAEFLSMTIRDIRPAEDLPRLLAAIPPAGAGFGGGEVWRHLTKDGRVLQVVITSHTLTFADRESELVLAHDVTEQLHAFQALADSERRFRRAIEEAPFPILMHAEDGSILAMSRTWSELSGYVAADIPTIEAWTDKAYGDKRHRVSEEISALYALHQRKAEGEYRIRCKDDGYRVWDFSSVGLGAMPDGRRVAISMAADVTERRQAEDELQRHQQHLEELVALRTSELSEARTRAESANLAKSAFLANMSHEIRTPMNAIVGLIYLMKRAGVDTEQAHRLDKIDDAGRHLLAIIDDILDLSKIEAGRLELENGNFHLSALLDNVRSLVFAQADSKGLRVAVEAAPGPDWLLGDVTRLRQALLNLAANAVKFTEHGTVILRARSLQDEAEQVFMHFEVEDTGIGVAADKIGQLFQPFQQADATTTRHYGGTGLGLAITRRLAELMGGEVGVRSEPGHGSTFWFTARLARGHAVELAPAVAVGSAEEVIRLRHHGARVLLVEDNEVNREIAVELLKSVALAVETAEDGQQAVQMAANCHYDLILMDMQMPMMDGPSATRAIRQQPGALHIPILAMTANVFEEDHRACLEAGMNGVVAKPVIPTEMFKTLLHWLGGGAVAPESMTTPTAQSGDATDYPGAGHTLASLSAVAGLNVERGLRTVGGDARQYLALLHRVSDWCQTRQPQVLDERAAASDLGALLQDLSGMAEAVGAVDVSRATLALERGLSEGANISAGRAELAAALSAWVTAIQGATQSMSASRSADPHPEPAPDVLALMQEFERLLERNDVRALNHLQRNQSALRAELGLHFAAIARCVEQYDFEGAASRLASARDASSGQR